MENISNSLFDTEKESMTSRIDQLRVNSSEQTIRNTETRYRTICSMTTIDEIR